MCLESVVSLESYYTSFRLIVLLPGIVGLKCCLPLLRHNWNSFQVKPSSKFRFEMNPGRFAGSFCPESFRPCVKGGSICPDKVSRFARMSFRWWVVSPIVFYRGTDK